MEKDSQLEVAHVLFIDIPSHEREIDVARSGALRCGAMAKSEVYSWRIAPQMKQALEEAARRHKQSISSLLARIVAESLRNPVDGWNEEERALQERLHTAGSAALGKIKSGRADRSQRVRAEVRRKLQVQHERARSH